MEVELTRPISNKIASLGEDGKKITDEIKASQVAVQEQFDKSDKKAADIQALRDGKAKKPTEQSETLRAQDNVTQAVIEAELYSRTVSVGSIFAFGLVAFGFLCMGPVNIAVDSYGPVTDNAQSVFELAQTENIPGIKEEIKRDFGFVPDFEVGKHYLEANDSAGNTFKATAKPVLIGTAVVGATTMIFSIILLLGKAGMLSISLADAPVLLGLICGGAVIYWFCGASMQAVTTGAYSAVEYIKKNMNLNKTRPISKIPKPWCGSVRSMLKRGCGISLSP